MVSKVPSSDSRPNSSVSSHPYDGSQPSDPPLHRDVPRAAQDWKRSETSSNQSGPPLNVPTTGHQVQICMDAPQNENHSKSSFEVFISHAGEDKHNIAIPLYERLLESKIPTFLDKEELKVGQNAPKEMQAALDTAPIGIFILSPEFAAKKWPMYELQCFLTRLAEAQRRSSSSFVPTLIPVFYRLTVTEIRRDNVIEKHRASLIGVDIWERISAGETSVQRITDALRRLAAHTGIENDCYATNEHSRAMMNARMKLVKKIHALAKSVIWDVAYYEGRSCVFSTPIYPAQKLIELQGSQNNRDARSVEVVICNNTPNPFKLISTHIVSGTVAHVPDTIMPRKNERFKLKGSSTLGIKMALLFRWLCEKEVVTIFIENTPNTANTSGIRYDWDTWEGEEWYYERVIPISKAQLVEERANDLKMKSFITAGDNAGAAFVVHH